MKARRRRGKREALAAAAAGLLGGWVATDLYHFSLALYALRVLLRFQLLSTIHYVEDLCAWKEKI